MELFLVGEHGGVVSTSGKEAVKRTRRTRAKNSVGSVEIDDYSSLREEIRLMIYLASRSLKNGQESVSETKKPADLLSSRCA